MTFNYADLIAGAEVQSSSRYFEQGTYLVQIDACKVFHNRQRRPRAAVECTVIKSNNSSLPATTSASWVVSLDSDSGPGNLKTFITDIFGCSKSDASDSAKVNAIFPMEDSTTPSIAVGLQAIVNAYEKPTKAGGVFTRVLWTKFDPKTTELPEFTPLTPSVSPEAPSSAPDADPIPF